MTAILLPAGYALPILAAALLLGIVACGGSSGGSPASSTSNSKFESSVDVQVRFNGKRLAAVFLQRKLDRRYIFRAFPRGLRFAANAGPVEQVSFPRLRALLAAREEQAGGAALQLTAASSRGALAAASKATQTATPTATATPYSNTGFSTGYSSSIGPTSGDCFNFTVNVPNAPLTKVDFSSESSSSSFSSVLKTSDSISTANDAFQSSDDFSYTSSYEDTANSGQVMFTAESIYELQPILNTSVPLNDYGTQQSEAGTFSQLCGDNFIDQVPAGAVIMGQFSWSSTSSTASTDVSNNLTVGSTLFDISSAISSAQSVSSSITTFDFDLTMAGGGATPTADMLTAYENAAPYLAYCTAKPSNQTDCDTFVSDLNTGAANALADFNNAALPSSGTLPQDLSIFQQLPNGISGVDTNPIEYFSLSSVVSGVSDAFEPYATQLNDYMGLINQIATLNNRVNSLNTLAGGSSFDPTTDLPLEDYFNALSLVYSTDLATMLDNMSSCLTGTGTVADNCAAIIDNTAGTAQITNAYQWYSSDAPNPNGWSSSQLWTAQQNTIALQYNAVNSIRLDNLTPEYQTPMQVMYIGQLPTFSSPNTSLSGQSALVTFADQEFYSFVSSGKAETYPFVVIPPIEETGGSPSDLSTIYSKLDSSGLGVIVDTTFCSASKSCVAPVSFITPTCTPTISDPCSFEFGYEDNSDGALFYENYVNIPNFFTAAQ